MNYNDSHSYHYNDQFYSIVIIIIISLLVSVFFASVASIAAAVVVVVAVLPVRFEMLEAFRRESFIVHIVSIIRSPHFSCPYTPIQKRRWPSCQSICSLECP